MFAAHFHECSILTPTHFTVLSCIGFGVVIVTTLQPLKQVAMYMSGLGLVLGLFSALLDMFRTRSPMFDRLQRRNNSHSLLVSLVDNTDLLFLYTYTYT